MLYLGEKGPSLKNHCLLLPRELSTVGLPNGQGQRSIQIVEGLRVPFELFQAPGDQHRIAEPETRTRVSDLVTSECMYVASDQVIRRTRILRLAPDRHPPRGRGWQRSKSVPATCAGIDSIYLSMWQPSQPLAQVQATRAWRDAGFAYLLHDLQRVQPATLHVLDPLE